MGTFYSLVYPWKSGFCSIIFSLVCFYNGKFNGCYDYLLMCVVYSAIFTLKYDILCQVNIQFLLTDDKSSQPVLH